MADRDVFNVMAGEAMHGPGRYDDMRNIASVVVNRSRSLGVSPGNVVRTQQEFNAYGKALPKGASAYLGMAKKAWDDVATNGPVHTGTFYATPSAVKNLPNGLRQVGQTSGHVYFEDPQNRSIRTALGYRQPAALTGAHRAIADATAAPRNVPAPTFAARNVPTPTTAPRAAPTLSASLARTPIGGSVVASASSLPAGLTAPAIRGGRIGPNTTTGVPTPTGRPSQIAASLPDASRFGGYAPTPDMASLRTRSIPTPTANPMSIGSILGISPAAAATPTPRPSQMTARVPAGGLTASITPGAVTSFSPRMAMAPTNRFASRPPVAGSVPTPTSAPRSAQYPQRVATPTARPAARTQAAPASVRAAPVRDAWGGLREVPTSQPRVASRAATATPSTAGPFGLSRGMVGRVAGAALGSAVAGPIGGIVGGFIGGRIGNGTGGNAAGRSGQASSTSGAASRGNSERSGGFGGFAERDSVVGPDGGRRSSGGSKSSGGESGGSGNSGGSRSEGSSKSESSGGKSGGGGKGGKK